MTSFISVFFTSQLLAGISLLVNKNKTKKSYVNIVLKVNNTLLLNYLLAIYFLFLIYDMCSPRTNFCL